jgi:ketosteroid isomerase-like protein
MKNVLFSVLAFLIFSCNDQVKIEEVAEVSNSERMKVIYDAFADGDVDKVLANFTEDIQWSEAENFIYDYGEPLVGADAIVEGVFAKLGAEWEYWNLEDKQFVDVGEDKVLVTGRYKAKHKISGKVLDAQFAHLLHLKDTLLASFQQYTDTKQAWIVSMVDEMSEEEE